MDDKNNTGNHNTGDRNSGYYNSGNYNSGDRNSGDWNIGDYNSGDRNSGYCNTGDRNSGNWNSGHFNSGDRNSGHFNSGHHNSGNYNSGYCNSGDWNSGSRNSGIFNTDEPKMRSFGKETELTFSEFQSSDDYIYFDISLNTYVFYSEMTAEQKKEYTYAKTTGGAIITLEYKDAWAKWWEENRSDEMIGRIKKLPNFDASIFEEITGIKIEDNDDDIYIDGKKWSKESIKEALRNYIG